MDDSITRCPCGENKDFDGFMIQCEICQVWQHGECVGVNEANVPDRYFCKQCIPTHPIHQQGNEALILRAREARRHKAAFRKRENRSRRPRDSERNRSKKRKRKPNSRRSKKAAQAGDSSGEDDGGKKNKRQRARAQLAEQKRERKELLRLLDQFNGTSSSRTPRRSGPDSGKASARRRPTAQEQQRLRRKEEERRKRKAEERRKLQEKLRSRMEIDRRSGRPVELSPMYCGRKAWLLQAYQSDHRYNQYNSLLSSESKLPFKKRVLVNYMTQQWSASNPLRPGGGEASGPATPPSSVMTSESGSAPPSVVVPANGLSSLPATFKNTAGSEERISPMEMDLSPVEESTPMEKRCDDTTMYQFPRIESEEPSPQSSEKGKAGGAHQTNGGLPKFGIEKPVKEMVLSREEGRGSPTTGEHITPGAASVPARVAGLNGGAGKTAPMALDAPHNGGGLSNGIANGVGHNGIDSPNGHLKLGNGSHLTGK